VLPADLTPEAISAALGGAWCGRSLTVSEHTRSTNDDARAASLAGAPHGHVVVADHQTQGRGSRGRTWSSPAGSDLYFSVVVHGTTPSALLPQLTLAVGLAVAESAEALLGGTQRVEVKWPNDVWVDGHKLAGILVEASTIGERALPVVVGVGFNVNRLAFPADLDIPASSLALVAGRPFARAEVLAALLGSLETWLDRFARDGIAALRAPLEARLALRGCEAECDGVRGRVLGLDAAGALVLDTASGPVSVVAGTLRPVR
jgi:BirA family transcriptional regulator, biotin operon repressor / biotin---[acetyl-CoA-carboxylase] ligase